MDKFQLSYNPNNPESKDEFIIHLLYPVSVIQVHEGHHIFNWPYKQFQFLNNGIIAEYTLSMHYCEKENDKLMDRAWRWYRSHLALNNKNIYDGK